MFTSLFSLTISPYTPKEVDCEIYSSLGGNIEGVKSQFSIFQNDILYPYQDERRDIRSKNPSCPCHVHVMSMACPCHVHVMSMSSLHHLDVMLMSFQCRYHVHVLSMSGSRPHVLKPTFIEVDFVLIDIPLQPQKVLPVLFSNSQKFCVQRFFLLLLNLKVPLGPLGTSWIFRYLFDLQVPLGQLGTFWTFRYLLDIQVHFGPLSTSWTFRYLFYLQVYIGPLGTSRTFRYLLDIKVPLGPLGTYGKFRYLLDLYVPIVFASKLLIKECS